MPFSWSWIILPLFPPQRQFGSILDYFLILGKPISQHAVIRTLTDCSFDCAVIHPLSIKNKFPLLGHWGGWLHPGLGVEPNPNGDPAEHKSLHLAEYLFCTNILNIVWFRGGKKENISNCWCAYNCERSGYLYSACLCCCDQHKSEWERERAQTEEEQHSLIKISWQNSHYVQVLVRYVCSVCGTTFYFHFFSCSEESGAKQSKRSSKLSVAINVQRRSQLVSKK